MMRRCAIAWVLAAAACTAPAQDLVPVAVPDQVAYPRDVHPILEYGCATLDCHGAEGRPLRIFAETGLRAADDLRGQPITAVELADNARAAVAVDTNAATVAQHMLLLKGLAVAAGGVAHVGGEIWHDRSDPQYVCVAGWLAGQSDTGDVPAACALAATQVQLPPP